MLIAIAAGVLLPSVGFSLALILFGIVLFVHEIYLVGILVIVISVVWWIFSGRKGLDESLPALSVPPLGSVGLIPVIPLLAGSHLRLKNALIVTVFTVVCSFVFAGLGSGSLLGWNALSCWQIQSAEEFNSILLGALQNPTTWFLAVVWFLSAGLMVACSLKGCLWLQCVGVVVSCLLNGAALVMGELVVTGGLSGAPVLVNVLSVVLSGLGMILYLLFTQNAKIVGEQGEQ